jgi:hypothetical protein
MLSNSYMYLIYNWFSLAGQHSEVTFGPPCRVIRLQNKQFLKRMLTFEVFQLEIFHNEMKLFKYFKALKFQVTY